MSKPASGDRRYPRPLADVRRAAQQTLAGLGWSWKSSEDGGFDAVWTSRVFKFKDDIAVRLHSASGTLVRVRSASRVGFFDMKQNDRHVQDFFEELERQLARLGR
jgi:hypothetical protein